MSKTRAKNGQSPGGLWLRRSFFLAAVVLVLVAAAVLRRPAEPPPHLASSVNEAGYVGPHACAECHQERVTDFLQTNHFRTSRLPVAGDLTGKFQPGSNVYQTRRADLKFEMTQDGDRFLQTIVAGTGSNEQRRTEQIGLVYGAGTIDEVYHYWQEDRLFQLPIAFLNPIDDWGNAPNYRDGFANFSRETLPACLECHNTYVEHIPGTANRYHRESMVLGVTCEKCHGPGRDHIEYHRSFPDDESAQHIVHPGKLTRQQELDVCLQCHSEVEVRRRPPFSYRPGESLADYFRTHGDRHPEDDISANQIEGLSQSACYLQSEMTCNTCHNPHVHEGPSNSGSVENSCLVCHEPEHCSGREELPSDLRGACIDCHMPRKGATNFTFHTRTEEYLPLIQRRAHRIAVYPDARQELLANWYAAQPDAESLAKSERLRIELAETKRVQASELAQQWRLRASCGDYREALRLSPNDERIRNEFEVVLGDLNKLVELLRLAASQSAEDNHAQSERTLIEALKIKPNHTSALNGLALALEEQGKFTEAAEKYRQVLAIDPEFVDAYYNLGALQQSRGEMPAAMQQYRRAIELAPFQADARMNLGSALFLTGETRAAIEQFRSVLEFRPAYAEAHFNLAVVLQAEGELQTAIRHLREAVAAAPNWDIPHQQLAWIFATRSDPAIRFPEESVRLAERACQISSYRNPVHLDTLAAAYAATGQFAKAITAAESALSLARAAQDAGLVGQIRQRRNLYAAQTAIRSP